MGDVQLIENFDDDGGAGDHQSSGEKEGLERIPSHCYAEEPAEIEKEDGADQDGGENGEAHPLQSREAESEADAEHQKDKADLGQDLDVIEILDELDDGREGADRHTREEIPDYGGKADALQYPCEYCRGEQGGGEVA